MCGGCTGPRDCDDVLGHLDKGVAAAKANGGLTMEAVEKHAYHSVDEGVKAGMYEVDEGDEMKAQIRVLIESGKVTLEQAEQVSTMTEQAAHAYLHG